MISTERLLKLIIFDLSMQIFLLKSQLQDQQIDIKARSYTVIAKPNLILIYFINSYNTA